VVRTEILGATLYYQKSLCNLIGHKLQNPQSRLEAPFESGTFEIELEDIPSEAFK
jgi:hypothetical protein